MSEDQDSRKDADPKVEIASITGNTIVKKSTVSRIDVLSMVVRCSSCLNQVNHSSKHRFKRHIVLKVILCNECFSFYGSGKFSTDEEGSHKYCTWCGQGGQLFCCDKCPRVFCKACLQNNFGRAEVREVQNSSAWVCYVCKPQKLKYKAAFCDMLFEYCRDKKPEIKTVTENGISKINEDWFRECLSKTESACKSFHRRMERLKNIEISKSKSLRHLVRKMEQVVSNHSRELKQSMKSVLQQYEESMKSPTKTDPKEGQPRRAPSEDPDIIEVFPNGNSKKSLPPTPRASDDMEEDKATVSPQEDNKATVSPQEDSDVVVIMGDTDGSGDDALSGKSSKVTVIELGDSDFNLDSDNGQESKLAKLDVLKNDSSDSSVDESDEEVPTVSKTKIKPSPTKKETKSSTKTTAKKKLIFSDPDSLSSLSDLGIGVSDKPCPKSKKKFYKKPALCDLDDEKLKLEAKVAVSHCDDLLEGKTTIAVPLEWQLEDLDKELSKFCKMPKMRSKVAKPEKPSEPKEKAAKPKKKQEKGQEEEAGGSSSPIVFSSDAESVEEKAQSKDADFEVKSPLIRKSSSDDCSHSSDIFEDSEDEVKKKKSKSGQLKVQKKDSESSEDFAPLKKRKYDKLLAHKISSDDSSVGRRKTRKGGNDKKSEKRKKGEEKKKKSGGQSDSMDPTDSDENRPKKKRKRIKKPLNSSSENENAGSGAEGSKTTGSQKKGGRKDIRKIVAAGEETKEAQQAERDRRRRVQERQSFYNVITEKAADGKEIVTKKLVLEIDPESKEEIVEVEQELVEKLKPHQVNGVKFMWECSIESVKELNESVGSGCILAHCMGLGKTLQVITFLYTLLSNKHLKKKIKTALVICPYNTVLNWTREFEMWLENVNCELLLHEMNNARDNPERLDILQYWQREGGVLIISYDIFRRLAAKKITKMKSKNIAKIHEILLDPGPDIAVCDEGHTLKNEASAISKACAQLKTQRRIVLTGTPLQNNLKEYHVMLSFVKPHLLGTSKEFQNRFVNPIMNGQYEDSSTYDVKKMKKRVHILQKILGGCVQRCDYSALTKFLPKKHEYVISVKSTDVQIAMYQHYIDNCARHSKAASTLFNDYNTLRNLCAHPFIVHRSYVRFQERKERKELFKDDAEEDEDRYSSSFIDDGSESGKSSKSGGSGDEEVVKSYKTRSRAAEMKSDEEEEVTELEKEPEKGWYHKFLEDWEHVKIENSGKMILVVDILKECEAIGDKIIIFSQSILALDLLEDIFAYLNEQPVPDEDAKRDIQLRFTKGLDYFRMDGSTNADFRKQYIDMFNNTDNDRARIFLVSTKAGGLGTNLVGANRVIMMDASWNPSHDVQAIFRVFRFGQIKPVYIYRLLGQGTMEEKIYERQVSKLSLAIRVVDEQQIDRHFNASDLAELYAFDPEAQSKRATPRVPDDRILAEMLIRNKDWIVAYHEHDSLLQNETEEELTEEERKAAWEEYENEREGRFTAPENAYEEEMMSYCAEPDYNNADYEGPVLKELKVLIPEFINDIKKKYPGADPPQLRRHLLNTLMKLKQLFQQKHLNILRMKQDFLSRGSVPSTVNKYLEELTIALRDSTYHVTTLNDLIRKDNAEAYSNQQKLQAQLRLAQQQAQMNLFREQQMRTGGIRFPQPAHQPGCNAAGPAYGMTPQQMLQALAQQRHNNLANPQPQHNNGMQPRASRAQTVTVSEPVVQMPADDAPSVRSRGKQPPRSTVTIQEVD